MSSRISGTAAGLVPDIASIVERVRRSTVEVRDASRGGGCGVMWSSEGVIVTNAHVVLSRRPTVLLPGGRKLEAQVAARDVERDLAVLLVAARDLIPVAVRDTATIRTGELVLAIGSPWGLRGSAALGVIHSLGPSEGIRGGPWLQAAIRLAPGNSGGPLADADARVVGINAMVAGEMALAIPSCEVERFVLQTRRMRREAA
jgi:serine protease Do